jgi:NAD(P)-dependent dehydrogenase (short-subunit alcohol dehydrogenase family)
MDLNLKSAFFMTQQLLPRLVANGSPERPAKVINISSVDGIWNSRSDTPSYIASKAGLIQLTKHQSLKLVSNNVLVSGIAPGAFASNLNRAARDTPEKLINGIPIKRIGTWEDMAGAAIFLASRAGDYVVGETVIVDGGLAHAR